MIFDLEVEVTEILKYILLFGGEEKRSSVRDKLPNFRKILVMKTVFLHAMEK